MVMLVSFCFGDDETTIQNRQAQGGSGVRGLGKRVR